MGHFGDEILAGSIIALTLFWIFNVLISAFSGVTDDPTFTNMTGNISTYYTTQLTPDGYTYMIWNFIFFWILAGYIFFLREWSWPATLVGEGTGTVIANETVSNVILVLASIFLTTKDRSGKVYCTPVVFTLHVSLILLINCALYTSWLFIWDLQFITAATAILFLLMVTNSIALALFSKSLWNNTATLKETSPTVLNCYRFLIQDSLATYTTWTGVATFMDLSTALVYEWGIGDPMASIISLGILAAIIAIWIPLDMIVLDKYTRYMLSPLFVVVWGLAGIFFRLQVVEYEDATLKMFVLALLGIVSVLLIVRVVLTIYRIFRKPLVVLVQTM